MAVVADGETAGTAFRRYLPGTTAEPQQVVVFAHGGYFVFGDLDLQDRYCRLLAQSICNEVISVDYGLAPERSATHSIEDLMRCVQAGKAHAPGARVLLCGDSAGGAIVFLAAARLRDAGHPVDALLLTNPNLDLTLAKFDREATGGPDLTLLSDAIRSWAGSDPAASGFSPLHMDMRNMPPTAIAVGALDSLRPEAEEAHEALQAAGVGCQLLVFDGIGHGFMGGQSPLEVAAQKRTLAIAASLVRGC